MKQLFLSLFCLGGVCNAQLPPTATGQAQATAYEAQYQKFRAQAAARHPATNQEGSKQFKMLQMLVATKGEAYFQNPDYPLRLIAELEKEFPAEFPSQPPTGGEAAAAQVAPIAKKPLANWRGISAKTTKSGTSVKTERDINFYQRTQTKSTGVWIHFDTLTATKTPGAFEVQCFFMMRDDGGAFIYDAQRQVTDLPYDAEFQSEPIVGRTSTTKVYPLVIQSLNTGNIYSGSIASTTSSKGGNTAGWMARVVAGGEVIDVFASSAELKDYARQSDKYLTEIAAQAKRVTPPQGQRAATEFGNTALDRKPSR